MAWPLVPLSDLCSQHRAAASASDDLPYIAMDQVESNTGEIRLEAGSRSGNGDGTTFKFDARHVLYGKLRPYLNKVATPDFNGKCSTELVPLLPHEGTNRRFLAYVLRRDETIKTVMTAAVGARMPRASMDVLLAMRVPLPPLAEQQRIVEILDRAAAIQRLRRAAEEKAREIIPALFVDMFGDPVTNPKGWPMRKLEDVATVDRGRSRHRPRDDKALYNGSYPFIQTSEVANSGGLITQYTTTYSEFGLAQSKLWPSGTLCVTIAANIAKTGILQFAACFPDSVVAVIPGSTTNNEFLQAWLAFLQPTLEAQAPQLAQKNINLEILRALAVPMPPKSLQDKFSELCQRVRAMQALNDNSATVAISTNQSLASTLFSAA
jgi:type I restriction enzyme S subunit